MAHGKMCLCTNSISTYCLQARCQLGNKYGALMEDCAGLLALAHSLNIQVVGVAFHVGSGATNPQAFADAIAAARQVETACCMCCCWTVLRPVCPLLVPVSPIVSLLAFAVHSLHFRLELEVK